MSQPEQIRDAVLAAIEREGMTRAELARRAGWKPSNLGEWLNGTRDPAVSGVERVMHVLGIGIGRQPRH